MKAMEEFEAQYFSPSLQQQSVLTAQEREARTLCVSGVVSLGGRVDEQRLRLAIDAVVRKHEILRTGYRRVAGWNSLMQAPTDQVRYVFVDARERMEGAAQAQLAARTEIDLDGAVLSCRLIRTATGDQLVFALPRLAVDRQGAEQFGDEVRSAYMHGTAGQGTDIQYVDYSEWQRDRLEGELRPQAEQFWQAARAVPVDARIRWERRTQQRSRLIRRIEIADGDVEQALARLAGECALACPDVVLGLWAAFLVTIEERSQIVVAAECDMRGEAVAGVLGCFTVCMPVVMPVDRDASVRKTLRTLSVNIEESRSWAQYCDGEGCTAFAFEHTRADTLIEVDADEPGDFKLKLQYREPGGLSLICPESLFSADALALRASQFHAFVIGAGNGIDGPLRDIDVRGAAELRLLGSFNARTLSCVEPCIHRLFEARVAADPQATALVFEARAWTYRELNERANQLARLLRAWGVGPETLVAVYAQRSAEMVVALLGILKSGGAYLPIDPSYPAERVAYMLEDARPRVVLTQERLLAALREVDELGEMGNDNLPEFVHPRTLAYCIYTSGSTGRPKGCQIEHASLSRYLLWANDHYFSEAGRGGSFGLYSSLSFDLTVTSVFLPLLRGQCLHVFAEDTPVDAVLAGSFSAGSGIDSIKLTPSHLTLLQALRLPPSNVSLAIVGGEALLPEQVRALHDLNPQMRVYNEYGPTEATVGCVVQLVERDEQDVAIGRPIEGCRVYVLDARGELVPLGMTGELHIAGPNLARGYHDRPVQTAERFIPDPHSDVPGARMYRTGDLVRYRPDGVLEYVGRVDHQVKVRGHRIELGEIEASLVTFDEVRAAAVMVRESDVGERRLVAYVVTEPVLLGDAAQAIKERLRSGLAKSLPEYMVPAQFVFLRELPLNANGKVDRRALPVPEASELARWVPPRNETEAQLATIWCQVLKLDRVGVHDHFFELGGDSIVAIQVVSKARDAGIGFMPKELFQHPTIAELSRVARLATAAAAPEPMAAGEAPLTPIQRWFFQLPLSRRDHWNQSVLLKFSQPLDGVLLEQSLQRLVQQHDALRLRFEQRADGSWRQWYADGAQATSSITVTIDDAAEVEAHANRAQQSLSLSQGPLLHAVQMILPEGSARLLLVIHHLVVDGVSWRILLDDLRNIYRALQENLPLRLPARTASFQAWAQALQRYADGEQVRAEIPYWREVVGEGRRPTAPDRGQGTHQTRSVELDAIYTRRLLTQAHLAYRTQINDLLLAALARALCRWTQRDSVLVELEGHGREELFEAVDVTRTVGWFTTQYPVRLATATGEELGHTIRSIKQQLRAAPCNGVGHGVLRFLCGQEELAYPEGALQARFNYLGQFDSSFDATGDWSPAPESMGRAKAESGDEDAALDWTTMVYGGVLRIRCSYVDSETHGERIEQLLQAYLHELRMLVDHCLDESNGALSTSDVPLADITQEQLDRLPVAARDVEDIYALSPMQHGLLLHTLLNPGTGMYLMQDVFYTDQALDPAAVQRAWDRVVARHDILRTSFLWQEDAAPVQIVHRSVPTAVLFLDWLGMSRSEAEERLRQVLREEIATGFDVSRPCLSRLRLVKIAESEYLLAHSFHHLLMDAWCRSLLFGDFLACLAEERSGVAGARPEPRRYRDFIAWLRRQDKEAARAYWRQELAGFTEVTPVPLINRAAGNSLSTVTELVERLSTRETQALNQYAQEHRLTVNTLVQAAWALVLASHADRREVLFGATVAGRPTELSGIEETLGLFINSLPLRVQLPSPAENVSVVSWLQSLLARNVVMRQHEHLPLVEIQALSEIARGAALFETLFVFENAPFAASVAEQATALGLRGLSGRTHTNYPLTVVAAPGERFLLELSCDLRCFDLASAQRILQQLKHVLHTLVAHPHARLHELDLLGDSERARVMEFEAASTATYSLKSSYVERFEAQVRRRGDAIAARCGSEQVNYQHLNARANGIAGALIECGVRRDDLVVIYAPRSLDLLSMILGVFKSGAAYLALEPGYPAQRFQQLLQLARPAVLLSVGPHREWLEEQLAQVPATARAPVLMGDVCEASRRDPGIYAAQSQLAYVIYTSGSTGVPKGVMVEHAGMLNNQLSKIESFGWGVNDVIAQTASCSFDISVWQWLTALLCGARVEVVPDEAARDPQRLLQVVRDRGITVLESVPAMIQAMLQEEPLQLPTLRYLIATGEALPSAVARRWLERYPDIRLLNAYGPAECSDDVSIHDQAELPAVAATISIGRATANNRLYVLGRELQRMPAGAVGEICVAGTGVGRGYLHDPARTVGSFVAHPFSDGGEQLYRTGDLARYCTDGTIEYLGRVDQQVKMLGHRIELGEIEARLTQHPEVAAAAVLVSEQAGKASHLVAYVVPASGGADTASLRDRLRADLSERLPKYMVPTHFVWLTALPMNANGKIDRRALSERSDGAASSVMVPPQTPTELQLAAIWQEVLQIERLGIHDDFFELGGHSLLATQVVSRMRRRLCVDLPLTKLFEATTIAALAREVDRHSARADSRQDVATMSSLLDALEMQ